MGRVAVASRDGTHVDEHFGRAAFFRIYDLTDDGIRYREIRDVIDATQHRRTPGRTNFDIILGLVDDCDAIVVNRIGPEASDYVCERGIRVFEASGEIELVLEQIRQRGLLDEPRV